MMHDGVLWASRWVDAEIHQSVCVVHLLLESTMMMMIHQLAVQFFWGLVWCCHTDSSLFSVVIKGSTTNNTPSPPVSLLNERRFCHRGVRWHSSPEYLSRICWCISFPWRSIRTEKIDYHDASKRPSERSYSRRGTTGSSTDPPAHRKWQRKSGHGFRSSSLQRLAEHTEAVHTTDRARALHWILVVISNHAVSLAFGDENKGALGSIPCTFDCRIGMVTTRIKSCLKYWNGVGTGSFLGENWICGRVSRLQ
jgi:hypothetical protein